MHDISAEAVPSLSYQLDSAQRNERDPTRKLALCIRMAQEREGVPAAYKARQDLILRPRVRVQGGRA